jgi:hypothetical protein
VKNLHQPCALMLPWTSVQEIGGWKSEQMSHCTPFFGIG